MILSREWLSEFTEIDKDDKAYCDAMTLSGSKVEGWERTGAELKNVVVGRIKKLERHPDSDHMWVCAVDAGGEKELCIVTGAQNLHEGDFVPVALDGSVIAGGVEIHTGKLRGVVSEGMLCSLKELGLDLHDWPYAIEDGIFVLSSDPELQGELVPGQDIKGPLGLDDTVVEFEITNNRPDCLSVIGLARESAATFGTELKLHRPAIKGGGGDINERLTVEIRDSSLCPRYTARMVKDIKIGPSPVWMRRRLRAGGVRPINNIVDITNYVMLEYGQPMHAFDFSCVKGGKIVVRRAGEGESLSTLDGKERAITPDMLVIADESDPIGLAGVMGGGNSEITESTNTIVFESANFNGTSIRKTAIALGMRTDASGRYEKGLDPLNTLPAVDRACELVELLGAGRVLDGYIDVVAEEPKQVTLPLEPDKVNALLGTDIDRDFMVKVLEKLDFKLEGDTIIVPSFRSDIESSADIAEEVARFYGYDRIEPTELKGSVSQGGYTPKQRFERRVGELCRGMGLYEIMTYSFTSPSVWDKIRLPEDSPLRDAFVIQNPLGEDTSVMRTTSLPSMLEVMSANVAKRNNRLRLYELATVYAKQPGEALANEYPVLTLGVCGEGMDFFGLKGCVEALLESLRIGDVSFVPEKDNRAYHPGRCANIYSGDTLLGVMGQIYPTISKSYGIDGECCAAELNMPAMMASVSPEQGYKPLPRFPAIVRDLALVCDEKVSVAALTQTIKSAAGEYLEDCRLFDIYKGKGIPEGRRSLAFSLTMRSANQTLTDEHADEIIKNVLSELEKVHKAVIR